jgi:predicted SprT family Zn-dependent metalloprotease
MSIRHSEVASLARSLMNEFGLTDWVFEYDRAKRFCGRCFYHKKTISLSYYYVANEVNSIEDIENTIRHEIAHAIAGYAAGHGPIWQSACLYVGAKPERCNFNAAMPTGKYKASCPNCKKLHTKHRIRKSVGYFYCTSCGPRIGRLDFIYEG